MSEGPTYHLQLTAQDLVPQPVENFAVVWGVGKACLRTWCRKGWVPGAFQHPNGEWWVRPLALLNWDVSEAQAKEDEAGEGNGKRRKDQGQVHGADPDWIRNALRPGTRVS